MCQAARPQKRDRRQSSRLSLLQRKTANFLRIRHWPINVHYLRKLQNSSRSSWQHLRVVLRNLQIRVTRALEIRKQGAVQALLEGYVWVPKNLIASSDAQFWNGTNKPRIRSAQVNRSKNASRKSICVRMFILRYWRVKMDRLGNRHELMPRVQDNRIKLLGRDLSNLQLREFCIHNR